MSNTNEMSRRALLAGAAGAAGGLMLSGCGPSGDDEGTTGAEHSAAEPPNHVPFDPVSPDLPGTADGVPPGIYSYPNPPIDRGGYPLPAGEGFTALLQGNAKPIPDAENKNYDHLATQFGAAFDITYGSFTNYVDKFQVTMASGDLPDLVQIVQVAQLPRLLETNFTDLTDVLAGDGITKYPALANIPRATWKVSSVNGRIWGIAKPQPPAGNVITSRADTLAARGIDDPNVALRDGADLVDLLEQLTDADKGEFAMGADPLDWLLSIVKEMVGTPNVWTLDGDRFVHENETEQMKEALQRAGEIVQAGHLHPNSFSDPSQNRPWWDTGVTALYIQNFVGWTRSTQGGTAEYGNIEVPRWDGGGLAPIHKGPAGYGAFVAFTRTSDERLDQLLTIADFIASPFGTQQYVDVNYGVEGYSFEYEDGEPVKTPETPPIASNLTYCGGNQAGALYGRGKSADVDAQHAYLTRVLPEGVDNPALDYYSETASTKAATMTKAMRDVQRDILQGIKPISAWDEFVQRWKSQVGDQMAQEYAEAASAQ